MRKLITTALAAGSLLVGLALPAAAQDLVPVDFAGPVRAGEELTLTCPEGYQVSLIAEGQPNAAANFHRRQGAKRPLATGVPPTSSTTASATWLVPKGAKYAEAVLWCESYEVAVTQTGEFGSTATQPVYVFCPADAPWFVTAEVIGDRDASWESTQDQYLISYEVTAERNGVRFVGPEGHAWRATLTCSSQPEA